MTAARRASRGASGGRGTKNTQSEESVDPSVKTARNSRRLLRTGTVGEYKAMLPPQPPNAGPLNPDAPTLIRSGAYR